jgi:hypothetical protein
MKRLIPILLLLPVLTVLGDSAKLGTLNRDSDVMVEGLFPVFVIPVPDGATEVQIRASVTNFEPESFQLKQGGELLYTYKRIGFANGKPRYQATSGGEPMDLYCEWVDDALGGHWNYGYADLKSRNLSQISKVPADATFFYDGTYVDWYAEDYMGDFTEYSQLLGFVAVADDPDAMFIYRWCSTGQDEDAGWGTGIVDGDAKLFFSGQDSLDWRLQEWRGDQVLMDDGEGNLIPDQDKPTSLTSQLQPGGTPGRFVIFQPSRSAHLFEGGRGDWMRQGNKHLQWIVQFENPEGWEVHPDGSQVWNIIHPVEWRNERKELSE